MFRPVTRHTLSVRPHRYRGHAGFLISGRPPNDTRRVSIFARTREGADAIASALKDETIDLDERWRIVDRNL